MRANTTPTGSSKYSTTSVGEVANHELGFGSLSSSPAWAFAAPAGMKTEKQTANSAISHVLLARQFTPKY
jgi:hypothetical protein